MENVVTIAAIKIISAVVDVSDYVEVSDKFGDPKV